MHSPTATLLALRLSMLPRTSLRLCSTQRETLELLKLPELKEKLRAAGLPVSGRKASLVSRLLEVSAPTEGVVAERSAPTTPTLDHPPPSPPPAPPPSKGPSAGLDPYDQVHPRLLRDLLTVQAKYDGKGPQDGVFCDGGCRPNPGPGGWGAVSVSNGVVQWLQFGGSDDDTTNNRMELTALINALQRLDPKDEVTIYSDSKLCVQTLNEWAEGWRSRGESHSDRTHFSHMSHPTFPISHILISFFEFRPPTHTRLCRIRHSPLFVAHFLCIHCGSSNSTKRVSASLNPRPPTPCGARRFPHVSPPRVPAI